MRFTVTTQTICPPHTPACSLRGLLLVRSLIASCELLFGTCSSRCRHEALQLRFVFLARLALHAGDDVHAPRLEQTDRLAYVLGGQAASDDYRQHGLDFLHERQRGFPVKRHSCSTAVARHTRIEQDGVKVFPRVEISLQDPRAAVCRQLACLKRFDELTTAQHLPIP